MLNWETPRHVVRCPHCGSLNTSLVLEFLVLERYTCGGCAKAFETSSHRPVEAAPVHPSPPVVNVAPPVRVGRDGAPAPRIGVEPLTPHVQCPRCQTEHVFRVRLEPSFERWLCGGCALQFQLPTVAA